MRSEETDRKIRYVQLPSQQKFHESEARFKGFSGPIGSGKSAALCQEAIRMTYRNAGRTGLIGAPTYPMLRDSTLATLIEMLDANDVPFELNKSDYVLYLKDSESRILLRSLDEYERLRGTNLAWFGVDELTYTHEAAWLRLEGRLRDPKAKRHCGFAVWTPKGFDWVYRKFIANPAEGYEVVQAAPYENRYLLEAVPDFYERLKGSYDESFYRQEAEGIYLNTSGSLVYHAFDRKANVQPLTMDPAKPLIWALDFNVNPMCSVVAQCGRWGDVSVLDEIVLRRATTEDACAEFERRFGAHRAGILIYGDASGASMQTTGDSDYLIIRAYFARKQVKTTLRVPRANPPVRDRVAVANAALRNARGEVSLLVDPKCRELIQDFEQVSYREDSTQVDKEKDRRRTHLSDALGYLIWQEMRAGSIGERGERLL
ncbi:MAG TPA: terminase family protein [Bryobacteraceae bacterium]|nr:terminase family protein [Bryobacteraceae bacterium]